MCSIDHPKPCGPLVGEHPDEDLAPEAQIWRLYVDEAREYDDELVESENKNLDLMLLFVSALHRMRGHRNTEKYYNQRLHCSPRS